MKRGFFQILVIYLLSLPLNQVYSANISWKFGVSGDWNVSTNWTGDVVPGAGDYAIINAGAVAVTVNSIETLQGVRIINATVTVTGTGELNLTQGTSFPGIWHQGTLINNGTINIGAITNHPGIQCEGTITNGGTIKINNVTNQGINLISGSITNNGFLDIDNTSSPTNGTALVLNDNFTNTGTINIGASGNINTYGIGLVSGKTLNNSGVINIDNTSSNGINNSGTMNNMALGVINIGFNTLVDGRGVNNSSTFTNNGEVSISNITYEAIYANLGSTFTNYGSLTLNGGGSSSMWAITGNGGTVVNETTGVLKSIEDIVGGDFTNKGTLAPGSSPGRLNIRNIYNSGAGAKYLAELGGTTVDTQYDRLHFYNSVAANFDISSTDLEVQLINSFSPGIGDAFDIMTSQFGVTGQFSNPVLPAAIPANSEWVLDYTTDPNRLTLRLVSTLPIKLVNFNAKGMTDKIMLEWQTALEVNNLGFEIQRSIDGTSWSKIGFIEGQINSTKLNDYSYFDYHPAKGNNLYRLQQIDADGKSSFSNTVNVFFGDESTVIRLSPNPVNAILHLQSDVSGQTKTISIFNTAGKKVMNLSTNKDVIHLESLVPGIYFINIIGDNINETQKIIKN